MEIIGGKTFGTARGYNFISWIQRSVGILKYYLYFSPKRVITNVKKHEENY